MRRSLHLLRALAIFVGCFAAGTGLLLVLPGVSDQPERKGMRVQVTPSNGGAPAAPFAEGMPSRLTAEGLEQSRFRTVTFPAEGGRAPVTRKYLGWHLTSAKVDLADETAEDIIFRLFPTPRSDAEATVFEAAPPEAFATIRAGLARVHRKFVTRPGGVEEEEWEIDLGRKVSVESRRPGGEASLTTETLSCLAMERRVEAPGKVAIVAQEYRIDGTGMAGDAALGTFTVQRDVRVVLPTSAILKGGSAAPGDETVISSRGPLFVERLSDEEPSLTRVSFSEEVVVSQTKAPDRLRADRLSILLLVSRAGKEGAAPPVTVQDVVADGRVELTRGEGSSASAAKLTAKQDETSETITLDGPVKVRYEGVLAGAPGAATAEPSVVEVTAKDRAVLTRTAATGGTSATFTGDAKARRLGRDGAELLSLTAPEIRVTSEEQAGEEMTATGGAAFATPTVSGSADELRFTRAPDGREAIRLSGNPRVAAKVAPGSGFDPFAATPADTATSTMTITCDGALDLVTEGKKRTFTAERRSVVTKEVGGQETSRVSADSLAADLLDSAIGTLAADGRVEATGKLEGEQGGTWFASGESFRYSEEDGRAVLTGAPAEVRLVEDAGRVNRITAPTLTFLRRGSTFKGEGGVKATVFLRASEKAPPDPFTLDCGILEVTAAQDPDPKAGPAARISALSAAGQVVLTGRDRTARGESLRYEGDPKRELHLSGVPAVVTQRTVVYDEEVTDEFRSPSFRLRLKEKDIAGFDALSGGTFTLHRPLGAGSTAVMGAGVPTRGKTGEKQVERFKGSCSGAMTYDSVLARMTGNAFIEQEIGQRGTYRRVARFQAETIEARRGQAADGRPELLSAEGRGRVVGTGDTWQVLCDTFAVDFRQHRTTMTGKPARVSRRGKADMLVELAVYDYEQDKWPELLRPRSR